MNKSCSYYKNDKCKSCTLLEDNTSLPTLPQELISLTETVNPWEKCKDAFGSRAKAKMTVTGAKSKPIIGILDSELKGTELLECPLHKKVINSCLTQLPHQLITLGIEPYSINERSGELKNLIIQTNSAQDHLRLRVVLKSKNDLEKINKIKFNNVDKFSLSANIQPIPHQILEGPEELHLSGEELLWEEYNKIKVAFPSQSFMQVTPEIAGKIYDKAAKITAQYKGESLIDLFCGAGGFALSVAKYCKDVVGIELSSSAVQAAKISATVNGINNIDFIQADLLQSIKILTESKAKILICNPPRRGIGQSVIDAINIAKPEVILYSSCHALNFIKDYHQLSSKYLLKECTPFEMFPLTKHYEIFAVLIRKNSA